VTRSRADFGFTIDAQDGAARTGVFGTPHGAVRTPCFMPVGTLATVKSLDPDELRGAGASMILANAYHLHLRPGEELVRAIGGLHRFMAWDGPILTDSGGFQVFSLAALRAVDEDGVEFRSHVDGSMRRFTPERVMQIERDLGGDIVMQFDHVIPGQSDAATARDASERSIRWLARCLAAFDAIEPPHGKPQALFPVVQGGIHEPLRFEAVKAIRNLREWCGYGIGGLSVGEAKPDMYRIIDAVNAALPAERPRYLMGVGFPEDLVEGVRRGVDLFDSVAPTRMGRNAAAFTAEGRINLRNAVHRTDDGPLDDECRCAACTRFSRSYIRHLFASDEMLGPRLLSLHNVHFLADLMRAARDAIAGRTFEAWSSHWLDRYHSRTDPDA